MAFTATRSEVTPLDHTMAERGSQSTDLEVQLTAELMGQIGYKGITAALRILEDQDDRRGYPVEGSLEDLSTAERVKLLEKLEGELLDILKNNGGAMEMYRATNKLGRRFSRSSASVMPAVVFAQNRGTIETTYNRDEGSILKLLETDVTSN